MSGPFPPIESLLLHRDSMLMLDRVIAWSPRTVSCSLSIPAQAWYLNDRQQMPAWMGIELMAQAIAAHVALCAREEGRPSKEGVLLGTRRYHVRRPVFQPGTVLEISANLVLRDVSGLGAYDCAIQADGDLMAEANLKVYEPENFGKFLADSAARP